MFLGLRFPRPDIIANMPTTTFGQRRASSLAAQAGVRYHAWQEGWFPSCRRTPTAGL